MIGLPEGRWTVVLLCSLATFLVLAAPSVLLPVMYGAIMEETGWTYAQVTSVSSLKFLSGGITALLIGLSVKRVAGKKIMIFGAVTSGLGMLGMGLPMTPTLFQLLGFLLGIGSITTALACKVILSNWFRAHLGRAMGLAFVGGSLGGVALPIIGVPLIDHLGWQATAAVFGAVIICVVMPAIALFVQEHPPAPESQSAIGEPADTSEDLAFSLTKSPTFWWICCAQFFVGFVDQGLLAHTPLFLERDAGLGLSVAAAGTSAMMLAGVLGKLGFGALYDKIGMRGVALCWWTLVVGSLLGFGVAGAATMTAFVVIRGIAHGGVLIAAPSIALFNFPGRDAARVICFLSVGNMAGAGMGTTSIALMRDLTGSYQLPMILLTLMALIAGWIAFVVKPAVAMTAPR